MLAGSAAYAVAEAFGWRDGLERQLARGAGLLRHHRRRHARRHRRSDFTPIDPIKALFWSAVINGVIAVPIMAAMMMLVARDPSVMGRFTVARQHALLGWGGTGADGGAVVMMAVDLFR